MYPKSHSARIAFWSRKLKMVQARMDPYFKASEVLNRQYNNEPTTSREQSQQAGSGLESHITRIRANLVFGWIDQTIANLLERNPIFSTTPLTKESTQGAPAATAVSNYWYRETDQLHQDERILLDAFLAPYGVKKIGWTADIEKRVHDMVDDPSADYGDNVEQENLVMLTGEMPSVMPDQDHETHLEGHVTFQQDPELQLPLEVEVMFEDHIRMHENFRDRAQPDVNTTVKWEAPYGTRWDPEDFFVDPMAQDGLRDARWIAFRWKKPLEEVLANPNYRNTESLEPSARIDDAPPEDPALGGDDFGLVVGWEIWCRDFPISKHRRANLLITMAEGHDHLLRHDEEWPFQLEDYPAEVISFQAERKSWFTKPTLVMAGADNVQALSNEILDSFLYVIRKQKNVILYDSTVIQEDDIENILLAPDMTPVPVKGLSNSRGAPVMALEFGKVSDDKGAMLSLITGLFDRTAGTPQPVRGGVDETATASSIHERRTSAREARRGNLLAEFQVNTVRKFWQLTVHFRPERLFLIHPDALEAAEVTDAVAAGEYRFRIDVSSQSTALAVERKQGMDLLNLFAGLAGVFQQLYGEPPNLAALAARLLRKGYNDPAPEEILPMLNEGNQMLQPEQQLAMQEMMQKTALEAQGGEVSLEGPPSETRPENKVGPGLPRQFNAPPPNNAQVLGNAQEQ